VKGLVIKNTGSWYTVLTDDGDTIDCKIKGKFRLKGIRSTNPVAVGDRVSLSLPPSSDGAVSATTEQRTAGGVFITEIEDRRNYVIRKSSNLSKQSHILAANVDQVFLIVTVNYPETSTTFIDRFLASAEAYRIPVVLIFNKSDLLSPEELHYQEMMMTLYDNIGYQCVAISAKELEEERGEMREERGERKEERCKLEELLKDKITLFSGNSGVGKSTLLNKLIPGVELRTAEISDAHNTGMHTTTFSEMLRLPFGGWAIDTPGIKGFGTFDMEPEELSGYFREIFQFSKDCRFSNCTHTHEPGCAVLKAVEEHYIAQSRYQSYLSMLEDKEESKYREAF
jgi:ribosome biogenesis GTPase